MPAFNDWFPTSLHGDTALNPKAFGALGDGLANALSTLYPTLTLAEVQEIYPSATALSDTADWAGFTECFKHAFYTETSPGVWEPNSTYATRNKPVAIPTGQYIIRKPLWLQMIGGAHIYGMGSPNGVRIYNEATTRPDNVCIATNGIGYSRFENLSFACASGTEPIAFDLNWDNGAAHGVLTQSTHANIFMNCDFSAPGGIGCAIGLVRSEIPGSGNMCSETLFFRCFADVCDYGWVIANFNALNYQFILCGATSCDVEGIRIASGGNVVISGGSYAANGWDVMVGSGTCVLNAVRSESKKFVKAGYPTTMIGCNQSQEGSNNVFCDVGSFAHIINGDTTMGRLTGFGWATVDGCQFNTATIIISAVASGTAGVVRVTHAAHPQYGVDGSEYWLDGDEVRIQGVERDGNLATDVNGVWTIVKIDHTHVELTGSTFTAGTYDYSVARICPGPRFHLRDNLVSVGNPSPVGIPAISSRMAHDDRTDSLFNLLWADSGKTFTNNGATGNTTMRLVQLSSSAYNGTRGTWYRFIVMAAHTLTIEVHPTYDSGVGSSPRILKAGVADCTNVSSNQIGATIEIYLLEDKTTLPNGDLYIGNKWIVVQETGTWTRAGTPP